MQGNRTAAPMPPAPSKDPEHPEPSSTAMSVTSPSPDPSSPPPFPTPSTTVLCPASVDTSLSATVPTVSPSSPFTTPSPPPSFPTPPPSLPTLPDDVLRRILSHMLRVAYRGTPYYPPSTPLDILPLSEACTTLRNAVSRHLSTDLLWLSVPSADSPSARVRPRRLAWYRFAGPNLRVLTLSARLYMPALADVIADVVSVVADARPPLRTLDLSVFTGSHVPSPELCADLRVLLNASRASLTELRLNLAADHLLDLAADANLTALITLDAQHDAPFDPIRLLAFLHSLRARDGSTLSQSRLENLVLRASEPLPNDLRPEAVAVAAPAVKSLHYTELSALRADCAALSGSVFALANVYKGLEELVFKDATLDFALLKPIFERENHRSLTRISLNNCNVAALPAALPDLRSGAGGLVRVLDLSSKLISAPELALIARHCPAVEDFGLRLSRETASALEDTVRALPALKSLWLRFGGSDDETTRDRCRADVARALTACGTGFRKLVVQGESLSVNGLATVFRTLGKRLDYLVTGVYAPRMSMSRALMALIEVVKKHCTEMRILCFGLALVYDPRAEKLNKVFLEAIDGLEERLPRLATIWLRRNAASLLGIPRPNDFVDWGDDEVMDVPLAEGVV